MDLETFDRVTQNVIFIKNIAISMGHKTFRSTGKIPNTGKTVKKRYTNIWMKTKKSWHPVVRQATIIAV